MALEAARQLRNSADADGFFFHLTDILFHGPLPLSLFPTLDSTLEVQFISRKIEDTNNFQFDIFSQSTRNFSTWTTHCSGIIGWVDSPGYTSSFALCDISHDLTLLEKSHALRKNATCKLDALRLNSHGSTGLFEGSTNDSEHYSVSPSVLEGFFRLPPISMSGFNLPAEHKLLSIDSIIVPTEARSINSGRFAINIDAKNSHGFEGNIEIRQDDLRISFGGVKYEVDHLLAIEPAPRSLFFKPTLLPDISKLKARETMSLHDCITLVTHKWPMSDIKVAEVSEGAMRTILRSLRVIQIDERPRFQSLQILKKPSRSSHDCERVQYVKEFSPDSKTHILFSNGQICVNQILTLLRPNGLACVSGSSACGKRPFHESFEMSNTITDIDEEEWTLWRMKSKEAPAYTDRKTVVFYSSETGEALSQGIPNAERLLLQPSAIEEFSKCSDSERYDAIILDYLEKSIIATWPGQELLPWLQTLIASADSILWVTHQNSCNPFNDLAGTLLRTLQSEQPALKVTWLVFKDKKQSIESEQKHILSAYESMLNGENEIRLEVEDSQVKILRYRPDDELSSTTGLILPKVVDSPLGEQDYTLSLAAPQEPVILSSYPDPLLELDDRHSQVTVEASVMDFEDSLAFRGKARKVESGLGMFFAGHTQADCASDLSPQVVGWYFGSHRKHLQVPIGQLYLYQGSDPAVAAAEFAALATASCVTEGVARIREGDTFSIDGGGFLREALEQLCVQRGARLFDARADISTDFVISLDPLRGLLVNNRRVDVAKYLETDRGRDAVAQAWSSRSKFNSLLHIFDLSSYRQGFEAAKSQPLSTVITHTGIDMIKQHIPIYKNPKTLFSSSGAYILIGGLGGLGRFVCSWMVEHGAKSLVAISRTGVNSPEAQEAYNSINASAASLEVIKADATDRSDMTSILHQIRQQTLIKGIINMAMILGDAPMASMTGEEWDRALRVKIDSSWILHEETLQDNLDFFIMFSSIASVLGNRNQGSYNVGNTFLNVLASYRHSLRLPAVSIALGAMTDIGVLHSLNNPSLLPTLTRSGLTHLNSSHLASILLAAVLESRRFERSLIVTGLEMFDRIDGKIAGRSDQLYWTEVPEFGHLSTYKLSTTTDSSEKGKPLKERVNAAASASAKKELVIEALLTFLSSLLGFPASTFSTTTPLANYGLDSLSAVSCQYWFHRGMCTLIPFLVCRFV